MTASLRPDKPEKKFIEVNCLYETIFKEVGRDILGTPSVMRTNYLEKGKRQTKWCIFHEDYGHLVEDCISLKVRVDYHMQKGELSKYKKGFTSNAVVVIAAP